MKPTTEKKTKILKAVKEILAEIKGDREADKEDLLAEINANMKFHREMMKQDHELLARMKAKLKSWGESEFFRAER
jgi:uncharacterized coiled-coil protein SlyX